MVIVVVSEHTGHWMSMMHSHLLNFIDRSAEWLAIRRRRNTEGSVRHFVHIQGLEYMIVFNEFLQRQAYRILTKVVLWRTHATAVTITCQSIALDPVHEIEVTHFSIAGRSKRSILILR